MMMNQAALPPNSDPQAMTPTQQVVFYQEQARLCAAHAAHHAEQARLHADYVGQLIAFHGLTQALVHDPTQVHAAPPVQHVQQAPPGFHQAPAVNVGTSAPSDSESTSFDPAHLAAASASGTFAAGSFSPPPARPNPQAEAPLLMENTPPSHAVADEAEPANPKASIKRALGASVVGVLIGAALWGGIGFITGGWEFKYGAVLIGFIVGGLALKGAGAPSKAVGIAAGAMSLVSLLLGKALFELLVNPGFTMSQHIAYHTTIIDLIFYAATAVTGFVVASSAGAVGKVKAQLGRYIPALR